MRYIAVRRHLAVHRIPLQSDHREPDLGAGLDHFESLATGSEGPSEADMALLWDIA